LRKRYSIHGLVIRALSPHPALSPRGEGKGEGHRKEIHMPVVQIDMIAGRTAEKKEQLIKKVTDAIVEALQVPADRVHIILHDIPKENIGDGGVQLSKKNP
jgi:4-oxalocrotonate tautomerase